MLYVAQLSLKSHLSQAEQQAALGRRAAYQFPPEIKIRAEYWPVGTPQVIVAFDADSFEPIFRVLLDWQDVFDIQVNPATTAEEGLAIGAKMMAERQPGA